ncbi:UDP-glucose 4-epimerase GalE [Cysteiniphilum halobium]|uniref:UDP-glucose 4-epimerase GalE n=1 Tax=Cysteiniphilum halobium TaxID=2219059 RepID=UPI000E64F0E7|nr:UDP-glucose 4-epimerase GalE [Cysteiniphilum halobium]
MILITGGTGFIGSHTVVEFLTAGLDVVILDNLYNSSDKVINQIKEITNKKPIFVKGDIRDKNILQQVFGQYDIKMVIHFAALKAVGESVFKPLEYYDNNVAGTLNLLKVMQQNNVKSFVFSSSATVYGNPKEIPITENCPIGTPTNPYGVSKVMVEKILQDLAFADNQWSIALLRYFNPVGAHKSGLIGELPNGVPNNLLPYLTQVVSGKLAKLSVFGNDYNTPDGTGVRDYIHVVDLALGHLKAYEYIKDKKGCYVWNLGTGNGYSVLEVIDAFEKATGEKVPFEIKPRRAGDIDECWADCSKAKKELNWQATRDIQQMMIDSWRWQSNQ